MFWGISGQQKLISNVETHVFLKMEVGHAYSKIDAAKPNWLIVKPSN